MAVLWLSTSLGELLAIAEVPWLDELVPGVPAGPLPAGRPPPCCAQAGAAQASAATNASTSEVRFMLSPPKCVSGAGEGPGAYEILDGLTPVGVAAGYQSVAARPNCKEASEKRGVIGSKH